MENVMLNKIEFTFDSSPSESFMVACPDNSLNMKEYELQMLENNSIPGMLPISVGRQNDSRFFYYKITSKRALIDLLKRRKVSKNEFIGILKDLVGTILRSENYLLSGAGFILDENRIYVDPVNLKTYLTYLPYEITIDVNLSIKDLIIKLIVYNANIENKDRDNFLQVILEFIRRDTFSLKEFLVTLEQLSSIERVEERPEERIVERREEKQTNVIENINIRNNTPPVKEEKKTVIPKSNNNIKANTDENLIVTANKGFLGLLGIIQIAMIVATFMAANYLKGVTEDVTTAYAGSAGIFFCLDFLLIRKILEKNPDLFKKKQDSTESKPKAVKKEVGSPNVKESKKENKKESKKIKNEVEAVKPIPVIKPVQIQDSYTVETNVVNKSYIDETSILVPDGAPKSPYLLSKSPNETSRIEINKLSFLLGRMEGQVDYVSKNNAVGKIHAEILKKQGKYYIKDLNSRNGTFISNERIKSNIEIELKNNDVIQLANSEFTFICD